jgi:hypothetical protein
MVRVPWYEDHERTGGSMHDPDEMFAVDEVQPHGRMGGHLWVCSLGRRKMMYTWKVTDDGMNVYEDGVRVAKFEPSQFVHILAELSAHVRWQQVERNKDKFIESRRQHAEKSIRE